MSHSSESVLRDRRGISLLEILLALAIIAIVVIYFSRIMRFADTGNKTDEGRDRMEQVVAQFKAYYRSHQVLPDPNATPLNSVPLGSQQLDLSEKHRLDPWGNYLRYFRAQKQDAHSGTTITDIVGFEVNGRKAAGVLISLGPDQVKGYTDNDATNPTQFTSGGDDYLLPITLEDEAWDIVMAELEFLDKRVAAYDRFFAGVKNDTDGEEFYVYAPPAPIPPCTTPYRRLTADELVWFDFMDEDGCVAGRRGGVAICPPDRGEGLDNDPNCGRATIDGCLLSGTSLDNLLNNILAMYVYGTTPIAAVTEPYHTDPWGNLYQWGSPQLLGGSAQSDPRYHTFFSMGPDGQTGLQGADVSLDDITPY